MAALGNDRWRASFTVEAVGRYRYTVVAWVDHFLSWRHDFARRVDPEDLRIAALVGAELDRRRQRARARGERPAAAEGVGRPARAAGRTRRTARACSRRDARRAGPPLSRTARYATNGSGRVPAGRRPSRCRATRAWYEFFPRSAAGPTPARHGTFADADRPARIRGAAWASTCVYLPPIHPIGRERRKGRNNALTRDAGRRRQPVGDRRRRRRAQGGASGARHARRLPPLRRARARARHRDRARHRLPVRARPPLRRRASASGSAVAPTAACSTRRIRRRSTRTSIRSTSSPMTWQALWQELTSVFVFWIGAGRAHLPRRQSAHEGLSVLGVGDRRDQARPPGRDLPVRGVHAAEGDAPAGQARLHASRTRTSPGATPSRS